MIQGPSKQTRGSNEENREEKKPMMRWPSNQTRDSSENREMMMQSCVPRHRAAKHSSACRNHPGSEASRISPHSGFGIFCQMRR